MRVNQTHKMTMPHRKKATKQPTDTQNGNGNGNGTVFYGIKITPLSKVLERGVLRASFWKTCMLGLLFVLGAEIERHDHIGVIVVKLIFVIKILSRRIRQHQYQGAVIVPMILSYAKYR